MKKAVTLISSKRGLSQFLRDKMLEIRPKRKIPYAFVLTFETICTSFGNNGMFVNEPDRWPTYFSIVFWDWATSTTKIVKASQEVIWFIATIYGEAIWRRGGEVPFSKFVELSLLSLGLPHGSLHVEVNNNEVLITSSPKFEERFKTVVRVRAPMTKEERIRERYKRNGPTKTELATGVLLDLELD